MAGSKLSAVTNAGIDALVGDTTLTTLLGGQKGTELGILLLEQALLGSQQVGQALADPVGDQRGSV